MMMPARLSFEERVRQARPMMPAECYVLARPDPALPPPSEGAIRVGRLNRGRIACRSLTHPDRADQAVALWVPDGIRTLHGVIVELHRASVAARTDYHSVARALGFAVFGALVRWRNFERVLPDQLAKLAGVLDHPELAGVPWAMVCGSRNVAASCAFVMQDSRRDRVLCLLTNGGPGIAVDLADRPAVRRFRRIPIMTVNGTDDELVAGLRWFTEQYPSIRRAGLPWCAAPDWGGGHAGRTNGALYWPFLATVLKNRSPRGTVDRQGGVGGHDMWFPSAGFAAVWRAYSIEQPVGRLTARSHPAGRVELRVTGLPRGWNGAVRFFAGGRLLGVCRTRPFVLTTNRLNAGVQAVFATAGNGWTRPVVVAAGTVVNQPAGMRAAERFDRQQEVQ